MLVFISDLHIGDDSLGKLNLSEGAFGRFFREVRDHADRACAKEVRIVLLGDVFELLMSKAWLAVADAAPTTTDPPDPILLGTAAGILGRIVDNNQPIFRHFEPASIRRALVYRCECAKSFPRET